MSALMCRICGCMVMAADDGSSILVNQQGEKDCPSPYWIVETRKAPCRAVGAFFGQWKPFPGERARRFAATDPNYRARQIKPHGHQTR